MLYECLKQAIYLKGSEDEELISLLLF